MFDHTCCKCRRACEATTLYVVGKEPRDVSACCHADLRPGSRRRPVLPRGVVNCTTEVN